MDKTPIHSIFSVYRSIGRKAGLCNQLNCAECDCPAIVALALRGRIESPEGLRASGDLPPDIRDLICTTAQRIVESTYGDDTCPMTEHTQPLLPGRKLREGSDDEL
ncbi:hypothetical protein KA071_01590 [Candidatus Gracilibacteria bacterium]|nr:hypothetical protein [Candidatus Gracilibacteria bacterium]